MSEKPDVIFIHKLEHYDSLCTLWGTTAKHPSSIPYISPNAPASVLREHGLCRIGGLEELKARLEKALRHSQSLCSACKDCDHECPSFQYQKILRGEPYVECHSCGEFFDGDGKECPECKAMKEKPE